MKNKRIYEFLLIWVIIVSITAIINMFGEIYNLMALTDICISGVFFVSGFNLMLLATKLEKREVKNGGICSKTRK